MLWTGEAPVRRDRNMGSNMAEHEPILTDPPTQDVTAHARDYSRFLTLLKWTAIISFLIAMFVLIFVL